FLIAVALLALAVGVQSSVIAAGPWGAPWGGAWGAPWGHVAVDNSAWAGPVVGPWAGHGVWGAHAGIPGIALAQGPGLAHGLHGPGVYVAKTRGAVHTAPLAGHIASATSVNVAPAPGTH
ncbi:hypothetical protein DOY81_008914, partial [Sarcophaga bullata]